MSANERQPDGALSPNRPTIYLINQVSRHGHLDLYARLYSAAILEIGYRVVLIEQHDSGLIDWLAQHQVEGCERFTAFVRDALWEQPAAAPKPDPEPAELAPLLAAPLVVTLKPSCESLEPVAEAITDTMPEGIATVATVLALEPPRPIQAMLRPSLTPAAALTGATSPLPAPGVPSFRTRVTGVWRHEGVAGVVDCIWRRGRVGLERIVRAWRTYTDVSKRHLRTVISVAGQTVRSLLRERVGAISRSAREWRVDARLRRWATQAVAAHAKVLPRRLRFSARYMSGFSFMPVVNEINLARARTGNDPALVLFLYLDMMNEDPPGLHYLDAALDAPWAGILFHPRILLPKKHRAEYYFGCSNARGALFLNPHHLPAYRRLFPEQHYCLAPDVTEARLPPQPSELATRMRQQAGRRKLVLLIGSIGRHKGVLDFIEVIHRSDPNRFFFAMAGEVFWESFGDKQPILRAFFAAPPENCFLHEGYLEDEHELNAVIAAADIIFAVYRDFRNSSNTLTKAALLEKPIIVSNEYLMGERVTGYRTGAVVMPGNVAEIVTALEELSLSAPTEFGFADYRRDHSFEALKKVLADALPRWIAGTR